MHDLRFLWIRLCRRNKGRVGACPRIFSCDSVGMSDCVGICDSVGICELFHFRRSEKKWQRTQILRLYYDISRIEAQLDYLFHHAVVVV